MPIKDVPAFTFAGGVPAKPIAEATIPGTLGYSYHDFKKGLRPLEDKAKGQRLKAKGDGQKR